MADDDDCGGVKALLLERLPLFADDIARLDPQQRKAVVAIVGGKSTAVFGGPGTGKSFVLRLAHRILKPDAESTADADPLVCASTGCAADNLGIDGARTAHSACCIPVNGSNHASGPRLARMRAACALFVDEISMLNAVDLNHVDANCRRATATMSRPFGGKQVVFFGDAMQLPPVSGDWFFESAAWRDLYSGAGGAVPPLTVVVLDCPHRATDGGFTSHLDAIRMGDADRLQAAIDYFNAAVGRAFPADGIEPFQCCPRKEDAKAINDAKIAALPAQKHKCAVESRPAPRAGPPLTEAQRKLVAAEIKRELTKRDGTSLVENLVICEGAQVMYTINSPDGGLYNGLLGRVDKVELSADEEGVIGVQSIEVDWVNGTRTVVARNTFVVDLGIPALKKARALIVAFPLIVAYATTVHKSQGRTIPRLLVDLSRAFGEHMVLIALSRCPSLAALSLTTPISPAAIRVNPRSLQFTRAMEKATI